MNRTLLDECFRVQGRTKWYTAPDEIQDDLDTFVAFCDARGGGGAGQLTAY